MGPSSGSKSMIRSLNEPEKRIQDLLHWPEPLRDADIVAKGGHDASGLNAAIIVIRQVYRVLLSRIIVYAGKKTAEKAEIGCLESLEQRAEAFGLLGSATIDIPRRYSRTPAADQDAIVQQLIESVDGFFSTWKGPVQDLSFSRILGGEEACKNLWDQERLHLFWRTGLVHYRDDLWFSRLVEGSSEEHTALSLIEWRVEKHPNLSTYIRFMFAPSHASPDGEGLFMPVPNYPSVLRVRLDPGTKEDVQFRDLEYTEIPTIRLQMTEHQPGEPYLFRKLPVVPPPLRYKLFAAVRLRSSHGEPDLLRVFDIKNPTHHQPVPPVSLRHQTGRSEFADTSTISFTPALEGGAPSPRQRTVKPNAENNSNWKG
jgi:hypothetical protein